MATSESGKQVTITGSGFAAGDQASWERNGAADPKVQVVSTQFVSSTQLVATINIAVDAEIAFYDIAILRPGRKGGIGTAMFEVTQATAVSGTVVIRSVNENGEMTGGTAWNGGGVFFWSPSGGLEIVRSYGHGWGISDDGLTIAGGGMSWTRSGVSWVETAFPSGGGAAHGFALGSDPTTGAASYVGGMERIALKRNSFRDEPRLWANTGAGWSRIVLPGSPGTTDGTVNGLNGNPQAVGWVSTGAAVWEPDGVGGWTVSVIGPVGSDAKGINRAGTIIVGTSGGVAVYWARSGAAWSGPIVLPGGCNRAMVVDDAARIGVSGCPVTVRTFTGAVIAPPYSTATITYLGGLGDLSDGPQVWGMSRQGTWIVGLSKVKNVGTGAYWQLY